jgi:hypothetical protein
MSARTAAWAWIEARRLTDSLRRDGMSGIDSISGPPPAAARHRPTVSAVLRLAGATCLVRSAVLQRWDADHGEATRWVVGVARDPDGGFAAHAWLEGGADGEGFVELHRRPPT